MKTEAPNYNGLTFEQVKAKVDKHPRLTEQEKTLYLSNARQVIENKRTGYNLHNNKYLMNTNFNLISKHLINN